MCLRKPIQRLPVGCCVVVDVCAYRSPFHTKRKGAGGGDFWLLMIHRQIRQHRTTFLPGEGELQLRSTAPLESGCVRHFTADSTHSSSIWPIWLLYTHCLATQDMSSHPWSRAMNPMCHGLHAVLSAKLATNNSNSKSTCHCIHQASESISSDDIEYLRDQSFFLVKYAFFNVSFIIN